MSEDKAWQKPYKDLKPEDFPEGELVLKWKHGLWYRDNNRGYTPTIAEAGLYSREEAIKYCFSNGENGSCGVCAVPLRMAVGNAGYTSVDILRKIQKLKTILKYVPVSTESGVTIF